MASRLKLRYWKWIQKYKVVNPPLTDGYAIPLTLNYLSGTDPYFRDILPYANDQVLPFWIEHAAGTTISTNTPFVSPKIWVRLPKGCTDLDIYRKNPRMCVDRSDGNRTFDLFDDFLGNALDTSKWGTSGYITTPSIANSCVTATAGTTGGSYNTGFINSNIPMTSNLEIRGRCAGSAFVSDGSCGLKYDTVCRFVLSAAGSYMTKSSTFASPTLASVVSGTYYVIGVRHPSTAFEYYQNSNSSAYTGTVGTGNLGIVVSTGNPSSSAVATISCDWFIASKYQSPEPTPILLSTKTNPMWRN
jgi:hypothetical protein